MMNCDCEDNCNRCGQVCDPAKYNCYFDINIDPYDPYTLVITACGMTYKVKLPFKNMETDTRLTINNAKATMNYFAEKHEDILTGAQIGGIILVSDLRDVEFDSSLEGNCYEFIYRKYGDCGTGCESAADKWYNWNVNSKGAKQDWLHYVRGANTYACPEYLDAPVRPNEFWFAGWRTEGEHREFGYYQPGCVSDIPRDANDNLILLTMDPNTKEPKWGMLPLDCILANFAANFATNVWGTFHIIEGTPGFSASFNRVTGDFSIHWDDWDLSETIHYGAGNVYGKVNWNKRFDYRAGKMIYSTSSITWYNARWDRDVGIQSNITFTLHSMSDDGEITLVDQHWYSGNESWNINLNRTIPWHYTVSLGPQETAGPLNFAYLWINWVHDDKGYQQINFQNTSTGWDSCPTACPNGNCICGEQEDGTCITCQNNVE